MMSHRKDFEKHNFSFKIHCKPIYSVCYMLVQGLKGSYIIQSPRTPPKIQEIAFKNAGFCWIQCLSSAGVPRPYRIS